MVKIKAPTLDTVVDTALEMAAESGWDGLYMHDLAARLGVAPATLMAVAIDKNAIADAWFRRALAAMLAPLPEGGDALAPRERLELLAMRWFSALAPHRRVTAEMLADKMWPYHPHHWVPMIFDLSRLVQWWRDAAGLHAGGRRRQLEEIALTAIFVATLRRWCRADGDADAVAEATRVALARKLAGPLFG